MSGSYRSRGWRHRWVCQRHDCGRVFGSKQGLSVHRWKAHGINSTEARASRKRRQKAREAGLPAAEPFRCMCGLGFRTKGDLARHRLAETHYPHTKDRP